MVKYHLLQNNDLLATFGMGSTNLSHQILVTVLHFGIYLCVKIVWFHLYVG